MDLTKKTHKYKYDAFGRRIGKIVDIDASAQEARYFYNDWQVCEELDGEGASQATYVYGLYIDEVLNMARNGAEYYYHSDELYNVLSVSDANGVVLERYDYGDYGQFNVSGPSAIENPYLFTGRRSDTESGFIFFRARYLEPAIGQFTTRDKAGIWMDQLNVGNGFNYAALNPRTFVDPLGFETVTKELIWSWRDFGMMSTAAEPKRSFSVKAKFTIEKWCDGSSPKLGSPSVTIVDTPFEKTWDLNVKIPKVEKSPKMRFKLDYELEKEEVTTPARQGCAMNFSGEYELTYIGELNARLLPGKKPKVLWNPVRRSLGKKSVSVTVDCCNNCDEQSRE